MESNSRSPRFLVKLSVKRSGLGKYESYIVYIPKEVVKMLNLKPGDYLTVTVEGNRIILKPAKIE